MRSLITLLQNLLLSQCECDIYVAVAISNPTTSRLLSKLLADPDEAITEPVLSTSQTVDARIGLALWKIQEMVGTSISI